MNPLLKFGLVGIVLVALFSAGIYVGRADCERDHASAEVAQVKQDGKTVDKLSKEDKQQEVIYRDRIKIVRETVDDCLPRSIAGPVLEQLRGAGVGAARSAPH